MPCSQEKFILAIYNDDISLATQLLNNGISITSPRIFYVSLMIMSYTKSSPKTLHWLLQNMPETHDFSGSILTNALLDGKWDFVRVIERCSQKSVLDEVALADLYEKDRDRFEKILESIPEGDDWILKRYLPFFCRITKQSPLSLLSKLPTWERGEALNIIGQST